MKKTFGITALFFMAIVLNAQDSLSINKSAMNAVSFELLGNGLLGSVSYERFYKHKEKFIFSSRVGFLYFPTQYGIPIKSSIFEQSALFGKKHYLKFGMGLSHVSGISACNSGNCDIPYVSSTLYLATRIVGYRYQKEQGGFFYDSGILVFSQLYEFDQYIRNSDKRFFLNIFPSLGISTGYVF